MNADQLDWLTERVLGAVCEVNTSARGRQTLPTQRVPRSRLRLGFHVRPLPCRALPALLPRNGNRGQIAGGVPGVLDGGAVAQGCLNEAIQAVVGVGGAGVRGEAGTDQGEQAAGGGLGVAGGIGGGDAEDGGAGGRDAGGEAPVVGLQGAAERGEGVGEGLAAVGGERDGLGGHADVIVGQPLDVVGGAAGENFAAGGTDERDGGSFRVGHR